MTSLAHLKAQVIRQVGSIVAPRGYKPVVSENAFRRATPVGRWELHLEFIHHPHIDFDVTASVAARFDAVQDLLLEGADVSKSTKRGSVTIGANLGNLTQQGGLIRWTVASAEDVPRVVPQIVEAFERIGLPYLMKYAEPSVVLDKLLSDDEDRWLLVPDRAGRWRTALALAFVLGQRKQIEPIIARAEAALAKDPNLRFFRPLAERIRVKLAAAEGRA